MQEVLQTDIQLQTNTYKDKHPKKEPMAWRYAGHDREYTPPRISEKAG
ncbi:hypothetical protein F7734_35520 [Scytonema sp. UIC 10036]|nr:hypothetical protein [Scytonema sp. UIC 10036]MUG97355.1 hypothetical protein [Scytonema sp. UIC 10036]